MEPAGDRSEAGALWQHVDEGLGEHAARLHSDLVLSHQETRDLQERLMVSEATVHAQAEQLKDYRDLLSESLSGTNVDVHALTNTSVQNLNQTFAILKDLGRFSPCSRDVGPTGQ